jgi:hypothetical protein
VVEIFDVKYENADFPANVRDNCSHLQALDREKQLLLMLLKFKLLFDGMLGDWNLSPVSSELKEGMQPYHDRPYPIPHKHKKRKPTTVKNPQVNDMLERMHQVLTDAATAEIDMAQSVTPDDVDVFLDNAAWPICSTYHRVLKASPGAAIFG